MRVRGRDEVGQRIVDGEREERGLPVEGRGDQFEEPAVRDLEVVGRDPRRRAPRKAHVAGRFQLLAGADVVPAALHDEFAENLAALAGRAACVQPCGFRQSVGDVLLKPALELVEMALQIVDAEIASAFGEVGVVLARNEAEHVAEVVNGVIDGRRADSRRAWGRWPTFPGPTGRATAGGRGQIRTGPSPTPRTGCVLSYGG